MSKKETNAVKILWVAALLANVKSIFCNYDVDSAYALAMTYRHLMGDRLLQEMWEPHQTSTFLLDLILLPFYKFTHSFEWSALYIQVCGAIVFFLGALFIRKTFTKSMGAFSANLMAIFFVSFRPKQLQCLEFSNLMFFFSTMSFVFIFLYLTNQKNGIALLLSAICFCLECLAYPSAVITVVGYVIVLLLFADKKVQSVLHFAIPCFVVGGIYFLYFMSRFDWNFSQLFDAIMAIANSDGAHASEKRFVAGYFYETALGMLWLLAACVISFLISFALGVRTRRSLRWILSKAVGIFPFTIPATNIILLLFNDGRDIAGTNTWRYVYVIAFVPYVIGCLTRVKKMQSDMRIFWISGVLISVLSAISALLVTNLPFITVLNYAPLMAMVSIPAYADGHLSEENESEKNRKVFWTPVLLCLLVVIQFGLVIKDYGKGGTTVFDVENVVRSGPAKGIICGYMGYYMTQSSMDGFKEYIDEGENVLVVSDSVIDATVYMYRTSNVSHYSTISTPTYNENLQEYWSKYPAKIPQKVVVSNWYGDAHVSPDRWIMKYVSDHYECIGESDYWWFYELKDGTG